MEFCQLGLIFVVSAIAICIGLGAVNAHAQTSSESEVKDALIAMVKIMVRNPDQVTVTEVSGEQTTVLHLRVAAQDRATVIGRQGRTGRAIRTILSAAGMKYHKRFVLEILE